MPTTDREEALFAAVLDKPTRAERAAYLEGACQGDLALRARLEALLAAHDASGGCLDAPPSALTPTSAHRPLTEGPGTVIGPYKLLQQIGEGGMGVVYMAEQQEPVRRKVALKIIKPGMDSKQVIARFEAERQALAMMDHQYIARVFDAGTTESGRPYFVMELVHGVPITRFCDDNTLTPRERLALFVPVCQAIQHAHQKGIIHRDVKPSNVLVTMYDDKPVPKVIDFGVAKAIEQRLTEKSLFTQFGALVGTFEYMSPEQAEMNAFGVDTRSDVYSLGVLLYELLTGTTPIERTRLRQAALDEMVRLIKEEEAPRPSVRLSTSSNLPKIAAARKTEPAQLSRLVRGEVDWIVMKCLEKDRARRYETANGLARDVERHLADEPVEACPPSAGYRLRKFVRRNKMVVIPTLAVLASILLSVVGQTANIIKAKRAQREAREQRDIAQAAKQEAVDARGEADKQRDEAHLNAYATGMGLAQRAWEEGNVLRARELLDEVVLREATGRNLRGFEWLYLSRLFHPELQTLRHSSSFMSVAFSPDGQRLASGSTDGTVKIWESATGKALLSLKGHAGGLSGVAFSPDGRRLASAEKDGTVQVWDSATGKPLLALKGHARKVHCVAFSPDGRRIASGGKDKTARIWDSATGKELFSLKGHTDVIMSLAFSPVGQRLASGGQDGTVKLWDSATGKEVLSLKANRWAVTGLAFSPDGRRIASGGDDSAVKIWDSATGKELLSIKSDDEEVWCVAFSPDGRRIATGGDGRLLKLWDSATGELLHSYKGHAAEVTGVAWSRDGRRLASASHDRTVKIWDAVTVKEPFSLQGHKHVWHVNESPNGQRFVLGGLSVAYSPDGERLATGSHDKTVKIWDRATGKELLSIKDHSGSVSCVAYSPDGLCVASGSHDKTVKIWDRATGKQVLSLAHASGVWSVAFSPDGLRVASGGDDKTARIWDSATGKELFSLKGHTDAIMSVAFRPDGQRLASGSRDGTVRLWDSATGKEVLTFEGHARGVHCVAFSPDGMRLAWANWDKTAKIWDSATGKQLTLKGHAWPVTAVAFSPDGRRVATGSHDGTVRIWDSATGKELLSLKAQAGKVFGVAFSPDGRRLASANEDGSVSLWETSVSSETQDRRVVRQLVADLFDEKGLRADVLDWVRTVPGMSPIRRQEALTVAETYPEDPEALNDLAWDLLKLPGRAMSDYRQALRYSEAACRLEPEEGVYLTTLGVAHYRVGNHDKALETLLRSDKIHQKQAKGSLPTDLAFLAMAQHRLGHAQEAQTYLRRLRERMKDPRWAQNADAQGFLREAEALLAK